MSRKIPTFFVRPCDVCGRILEIPINLLGEWVTCEHCQATFIAYDPSSPDRPDIQTPSEFMERVDLLLAAAHNQRNRGSLPAGSPDSDRLKRPSTKSNLSR